MGGGGFLGRGSLNGGPSSDGSLSEGADPRLDDFALQLTQKTLPKVCFLATASGDAKEDIDRFYAAFPPARAKAMHLSLFARIRGDLCARLLDNDLIAIGGGNTANLLALWRLHGLDQALRQAWESGVVIAGVSAGACCLFESCLTDSFGPSLSALDQGLGLIPGSFCPHYRRGSRRRPRYRQLIGEGLAPGYAADDDVALHFIGQDFNEAVSARAEAAAFRVHHHAKVHEERLAVRLLDAT